MNLDTLIEQIRTEVVHLSQGASPDEDLYRQQTALSLIARVPVMQSSAIYSSLIAGGIAPRKLDAALDLGAGICGHHVELGVTLTRALNVPCRRVQVFYTEDGAAHNHTFVEIEWGQQWRMVDLTWGFIPHRGSLDTALSYAESLERNHRTGLHHSCIPWRLAVENTYDIFGYLNPEPEGILYDGSGEIRMAPTVDGDSVVYPMPHRMSEIGRVKQALPNPDERRMALGIPARRWLLTAIGNVSGPGTLDVDSATVAVTSGELTLQIETSGPRWIAISFDPAEDSGHIDIESIRGTLLPARWTEDPASEGSHTAIRLLDQSQNQR